MIVFLAAVYLDEFNIVAVRAFAQVAPLVCFELFETPEDDGFFLLEHDVSLIIL